MSLGTSAALQESARPGHAFQARLGSGALMEALSRLPQVRVVPICFTVQIGSVLSISEGTGKKSTCFHLTWTSKSLTSAHGADPVNLSQLG